MRALRGLIADQEGAVHMIEAVLSAFLVLSALACAQTISALPTGESGADLAQITTDLVYVLEHSEGRPGHPDLAQAMSSQAVWEDLSPDLEADIRDRLPDGCRAWVETPYGSIGDEPPDLAVKSVRPFLVYRQETGKLIGCRLVVWRP
jgi:hypothetical protein